MHTKDINFQKRRRCKNEYRIHTLKKEIISIVYHLLSQMQEDITDFKFYEIMRLSNNFLLVSVDYTWSLNGHKKPVNKINRSFYKEDGDWYILV